MAYMKLLSAGVSAKQCPSVVQIVLAAQPCCDLDINVGDLPSRTFANTLRNELAALCKIDMAVKIGDHAHQHAVLGSDEGTCNQESSNALVAHYNDIPSQCLGVDKMGSHFSQEGADKTQKMMESYGVLSKRVSSSLGKIDLSGAERDLVYSAAAFSSTITDQCNTQKKTNSLLDDIKAMKVAQWSCDTRRERQAQARTRWQHGTHLLLHTCRCQLGFKIRRGIQMPWCNVIWAAQQCGRRCRRRC